MIRALALACCALLSAHVVSAQIGTSIPDCTSQQAAQIANAVDASDILDNVTGVADALGRAAPEDLTDIIAELDSYQQQWWATIAPDFPRCALAFDLNMTFGRYLDELLLSVSHLQIAYAADTTAQADVRSWFSATASSHSVEFQLLADDMGALGDALRIGATESRGADGPTQPSYVVVSQSPANVRALASTASAVLITIAPGSLARVIGIEENGESVSGSTRWYIVSEQGRTGYVHSSVLAPAG